MEHPRKQLYVEYIRSPLSHQEEAPYHLVYTLLLANIIFSWSLHLPPSRNLPNPFIRALSEHCYRSSHNPWVISPLWAIFLKPYILFSSLSVLSPVLVGNINIGILFISLPVLGNKPQYWCSILYPFNTLKPSSNTSSVPALLLSCVLAGCRF